MNTWTDIKEPIEYLYSKFCSGEDPTYLKRNIYAYSVSLGAGMLAQYLMYCGEKCVLNGALGYGLFYNLQNNIQFFKRSAMKLYDMVMGFNYSAILNAHEDEMRA